MVQGLRLPPPRPRDFKTFGAWLEAATAEHGQKAALARKIGKNNQDVNGWINEGKQPNSKTLAAIAKYFSVPYFELLAFWDQQVVKESGVSTYFQGSRGEPGAVHTVPVKGAISPVNGGFWMDTNKNDALIEGSVHWITSAPELYAFRVLGDELFPRVRGGEFVIVDPRQPCNPGDEILIALADGRHAILQLVSRTAGMLSFQRIGSDHRPVTLREAEVLTMHPIMGIAKPAHWIAPEGAPGTK